jgi:hypothetical protein
VPGQLVINLQAVPNAKSYQLQYYAGDGTLLDMGIFPNTRNILISNTVAGTTYSARIHAVGGSTHYSPWSAVMTLMST